MKLADPRRALAVVVCCVLGFSPARAINVSGELSHLNIGVGSTLAYPLYFGWAGVFEGLHGKGMDYQAIGSSAGVKAIKLSQADFGATDVPLDPEQLEKHGLIQFPMAVTGVIPVVNLHGVAPGQLKLTGELMAKMFMGEISYWDDPQIKALNPDIFFPKRRIFVMRRTDGSGATNALTSYLSAIYPQWQQKIGSGKKVTWPLQILGLHARGSDRLARFIQTTPGALGYVGFAQVKEYELSPVSLQNHDGNFVAPSLDSFTAAAAEANWQGAANKQPYILNMPGADSWPITTATYAVIQKSPANALAERRTLDILTFFNWCYDSGDALAEDLGYVPLPDHMVQKVKVLWQEQVKDLAGNAVLVAD